MAADHSSDDASARRTLERLGAILGRPPSDFHRGDDPDPRSTGQLELVALWNTLKVEASRQAVLKLVRAIAEAEGD